MKLAVPYKDGEVFQHFGHSEAFRIYTIEDGAIVATATINTEGVGHEALAQLLRGQGVETVIAGGIGDGAERALTAEGIDLCSGVSGPADAIVEAYIASTLEYGSGANCSHHHDHDDDEEGGCGGGCGGCGGCGGGCHGGAVSDYVETRTFTEIVELTVDNFEAEVLADPGLICIDFWAPWCQPCKMMAPNFEAANLDQPRVKFCRVNTDEQPELAQLFGIDSIPTVALVQNRRTLTGFVGVESTESLNLMIGAYLP